MENPHRLIFTCLLLVPFGAGCGGGQACNQLALPSTTVTVQPGRGLPPAATGGAIADGTYVLTSVTDFEADDGLVGQPTSGVLVLSGGALQSVSSSPKGGGLDRSSATFVVSDTTMTETGTCGLSAPLTQGYTATATTLSLIQASPAIVSTFTRSD
jgi:hypothetical protein